MTRKFFKFFIFLILTFSLCMQIDAAKLNIDGQDREVLNVNISINGQATNTNLPVFVVNERTYVPVRFVSESLGYKVIWLQNTFTVEIRGADKKMWFPVGKAQVNLGAGLINTPDGVKASIVRLPGYTDGFTYVPVRFIAEYMGQKIDWDQATMTVKIGQDNAVKNPDLLAEDDKPEVDDNQSDPKDNINEDDKNESTTKPANNAWVNLINVKTSGEEESTPKMYFNFDGKMEYKVLSNNGSKIIFVPNAQADSRFLGNFRSALKNSSSYNISQKQDGIEIEFVKGQDGINLYLEDGNKTLVVIDSHLFKGLQIADHNGSKAYVLKGMGKQQYKKFEFDNPKRVAIDFLDSELEGTNYVEFKEAIGFISSVRMSQFVPDKNYDPNDKILRVVFDIEDGIKYPDLKIETVGDDLYVYPVESLYNYFKFRNSGTIRYITIKDYDKPIDFSYNQVTNKITARIDRDIPDGIVKYNDSLVRDLVVENNIITISLVRNVQVESALDQDGSSIKITRVRTGKNSDYLILIDPGHGGTDPGASDFSKTYWEKDCILPVQRSLERRLLDLGYVVKKTNDTVDSYVGIHDRAKMANELMPDIFVSIHANASEYGKPNGLEVLYASEDKNPNKEKGQARIAQIFNDEVAKATGLNSRGIKNRPEIVVVGKSNVSAVLLEMAFLTNERDLALLKDPAFLERVVDGLVSAIEIYLTEFR